MRPSPQTAAEIRRNLAEQLDWQFAERNDTAVAQALYQGAQPDAVYTLDDADLIGGFLRFLRQTAILADWQALTIAAVRHVFLPTVFFVLLYGVRVLYGITSTNALPTLLFSNVAVMTLLGFTAAQVAAAVKNMANRRLPPGAPRAASLRKTTNLLVILSQLPLMAR